MRGEAHQWYRELKQARQPARRRSGTAMAVLSSVQRTLAARRRVVLRHYMARLMEARHLAAIQERLWRPEERSMQRRRAAVHAGAAQA